MLWSSLIALTLAVTPWLTTSHGQEPVPAVSNPVLPGDYPDPSVIRAGGAYWATATTSQWAPIFPLLRSTDLVTWRLVGHAFEKPPAWSAGSYWAPEIATDRDRFFIYYTARKKDGPLCVAVADAASPEGPYRDHGPLVCQEVGSIDAFPITDERGARYLVWKEDGNSRKRATPLWAQPLSPDGLSLAGEPREILRNQAPWEGHLVEGPAIVRRDGWFYLFYSAGGCCGRGCNYSLGAARARALLGPWERAPANPLLAGNDAWKCPGHGTLVSSPDNRTFLLYHAYDPHSFEYVGRQGLLDEVTWVDGWPIVNGGRGPSRASRNASAAGTRVTRWSDDFAGALDPGWQWPWNQAVPPLTDQPGGGWLVLSGDGDTPAIAARPTLTGDYTASATLDVASLAAGSRAGVAAFGNRQNFIALTLESPAQRESGQSQASDALEMTLWQVQKGERTVLGTARVERSPTLHVRLTASNRTRFVFETSVDGRQWRAVGDGADGAFLPPWDLSVRVALLTVGPSSSAARFGAFHMEGR